MSIEDELKKAYPHGHPDFIPLLVSIAKLHSEKNSDYAQGGDPLGNFQRVSRILAMYPELDISKPVIVTLVYMLKQLDAQYQTRREG